MARSSWILALTIIVSPAVAVSAQRPADQAACKQNDLVACNRLGVAYETSGNFSLAVESFRTACNGGLLLGCSNLGEYYFDGRGVSADLPTAFKLFMSACNDRSSSGCPGACMVVLTQSTASSASKFTADCIAAVQRACDSGNNWMCPHAKRLATSAARANPRPLPPSIAARGVCPDAVARLVGRAYALSNPFNRPDDFAAFVASNRLAFQARGPAVACAAALGSRLSQVGMAAYDPSAYERAMGQGPAELAPDVARSINSGSVDMYAMGQELIWLATIFPDVASGRLDPFLTGGTETRIQVRSAMAMMSQLAAVVPEFAENLGFARAIAGHFSPLAEYQVQMLATMMPR